MDNILGVKNRTEFRAWLAEHGRTEKECFIEVRRGRPKDDTAFWYIDAVEEALCFGWIDGTVRVANGKRLQRFSPRRKNSAWTELNKERVRRLEKLGLMTELGRNVLPDMSEKGFTTDKDVETALKQAQVWEIFRSFPPLYQRIRAYNVAFYKNRDKKAYETALSHLISQTALGKTFGEWNDYGRLLDY